jgi:hypothetical protein
MQPSNLSNFKPPLAVDALSAMGSSPGDEISDEEANAEITIPGSTPTAPLAKVAPKDAATEDITPSVRQAIDKAAEILRQLQENA